MDLLHSTDIKRAVRKTLHAFINLLPIIFGMLLLTSLVLTVLPPSMVAKVFGHGALTDVILGAGFGGIITGHPLASYILGGELLAMNISLMAVTAFIVSWVTVGVVQFPAEALLLGARFAFYRNLLCFFSAIALAYMAVLSLNLLS